MIDLKDRINDWHGAYVDRCCSQDEIDESYDELELVLSAIDSSTKLVKESKNDSNGNDVS